MFTLVFWLVSLRRINRCIKKINIERNVVSVFLNYTSVLVLTIKWHLSGLTLERLPLNHRKRVFEAFYRDLINPSVVFAEVQGVLSSSKLPISTSFKTKNKSTRKMLNKSGLNIDPWDTLNKISNQLLKEFLVLYFLLDK